MAGSRGSGAGCTCVPRCVSRGPDSVGSSWQEPHIPLVTPTQPISVLPRRSLGGQRDDGCGPGAAPQRLSAARARERDGQEGFSCAPSLCSSPWPRPHGVSRSSAHRTGRYQSLPGPFSMAPPQPPGVDGETEAWGGPSRRMSASPFPRLPPRLRWGAGEERCLESLETWVRGCGKGGQSRQSLTSDPRPSILGPSA